MRARRLRTKVVFLATVLHLVLRLAGLKRFGEVAPESVKSRIRHLEEAADVRAAVTVEEVSGLVRVAVWRRLSFTISLK